jgi:PAS domain S-box-containing protein
MDEIKTESEILDSSEFLRALFEAAPDAILVADREGSLVRINSQAEKMFGYDRHELVGKPIEVLIPQRLRHGHKAKRDNYIAEPHTRQMGTGRALFGARKDGSEFPVDIMLSPLRATQGNLVIALVRDITEHKQAEAAQRQRDELYRLISQVKDYAIFMLDPDGLVATWNEGAERIKGFKSEEIIGQHFSKFYLEDDVKAGKPQAELQRTRELGNFEDSGWRKRKDGTQFFANVIFTALKDESGNILGFSKVTRDVTERKKSDDALKRLMEQREDFVATLTHDLKTPVLAANRAMKIMLEGDFGQVSDEQASVLQTILDSNNAMYSLVTTLLDVYRYDSGAKQLSVSLHDLSAAIDNLVKELRPFAQSREITIENLLPPVLAPVVCDLEEIRRVVQNLLDNALKYTQAGGHVMVQLEQSPGTTTVLVRDNGKGISNADKDKLFQRFWAPAASGRNYASTGLGLYLCRKIVELHGGRIWCESQVGTGSTFCFTLQNEVDVERIPA